MPDLSVNIDHVATIRQARYRAGPGELLPWSEPDPLRAAHEAEMGGARGITVHLREDRRHIQDADVERLREMVRVRFNLEMAATDEMIEIAREIRPHSAMLVPEGRNEVTTEGGLDVAGQIDRMREVVDRLSISGTAVSAFIDAEPEQVEAAARAGFDICELHTGPWAHAFFESGGDEAAEACDRELDRLDRAADLVLDAGMKCNAGHALNYTNVLAIADRDWVSELHIGHSIVSRSVFSGFRDAVAEMVHLIE
ncbi:MAG: pyridoxine 5'-phosphate synthase [Planctomycetota bacterium]